ncbi:MAG: dynamin family protein [Gemmatimonadota bacterium]|nr:dynamin family protein [Gemmatimonadota bacterium]
MSSKRSVAKKTASKKKATRKKKAVPKKTISSRKTEALSSPPQEDTRRTDLKATIACLLALRSVRDQFADAELDLLTGELADKLDSLEKGLIDHLAAQREHQEGLGRLTVSVVGDFNSGKSTFINALLEMDLCPVGDEPTTASVTYFVHGDQERIEQESADRTWVSLDKTKYRALASHKKEGDSEPHTFRISVNSPVLDHIRFVDTPGFNAPPPNANDTRVTEEAVMDSDVLFVIMDANKGNPADTLLNQLSRLSQKSPNESRQPIFLLLNKAEHLPPSQRREVKRFCKENHGDRFSGVVLVSAKQLNEAKDEEPLDALDSAMQRMRSAYKARDSFQESISAKLTEKSYIFDISGNVYDVPTSSDFELASREQLAEMVKNVAAERHVLLEQQFQRQTLQLRENWQTTLSELDLALKRALSESSRFGESHHEKRKKTALNAIEKAKIDTFTLISGIFQETPDKIVAKGQRTEEGFWSNTEHYQVHIYLGKASDVMGAHDNWRRMLGIYQRLFSYIGRFPDINFDFTPQEVVEQLKAISLETIRNVVQEIRQDFRKDEEWEIERSGKFWQCEYEDEDSRDKIFDEIISRFALLGEDIIDLTIIEDLKATINSTTGRNQAQATTKAKELKKLQERINGVKEHVL